ncbi:carbohydrate ABC transporter permease [Microbacterium trichothecenolyticum]
MSSSTATSTIVTRGATQRFRVSVGKIISIALLVVGGVGMVAPFLWMFVTSLKSGANVYDLPPTWIPREFNWNNYIVALNGPLPLLQNLGNSLFIAILGTAGVVITAPMAGYAFAKMRFAGQNVVFMFLLAALMVPVQVTIIPLFLIMRNLGLVNTPWSLILPALTWGFGVFLMRQFFLTVPNEILEAARIDGAGPWRTYFSVALPLVKNGVSALAIITFLNSPFLWNAYFAPSIFLNSQDTATMPLALVLMRGPFATGQINVLMAATAMIVIPALIVFLLAQRWIIAGMTQSGVKG